MLIAENWIQRIAMEVKKSPEEIRVSYSFMFGIGSQMLCLMEIIITKKYDSVSGN